MKNKFYISIISIVLVACNSVTKENSEQKSIEGYYEGKALFEKNCAVCHQQDGEPDAGIFPPLKNSDFLQKNQQRIPCIIKNGVEENLTVNGKKYEIKMLGFNNLSAEEVAQIINYINNSWGNEFGTTSTKKVKEQLGSCK
jgi:mono/diheme cytochrome c family protein